MPKKKITVNEVVMKDLKVVMYLLAFGLTAFVSQEYLQAGSMGLVFGATANYLLFRFEKELGNEGYRDAVK